MLTIIVCAISAVLASVFVGMLFAAIKFAIEDFMVALKEEWSLWKWIAAGGWKK